MLDLLNLLEHAARLLEFFGVGVIFASVLYALVRSAYDLRHIEADKAYRMLRQRMGRGILLGLEILIAADIVATVITRPDLENALALAVIVIIRTILSLSIEVEIDGQWPWLRGKKR